MDSRSKRAINKPAYSITIFQYISALGTRNINLFDHHPIWCLASVYLTMAITCNTICCIITIKWCWLIEFKSKWKSSNYYSFNSHLLLYWQQYHKHTLFSWSLFPDLWLSSAALLLLRTHGIFVHETITFWWTFAYPVITTCKLQCCKFSCLWGERLSL